MIEISFSMMAWMTVVAVHAIIHFGIFGNRRKRQALQTEELLLSASTECDPLYACSEDRAAQVVDECNQMAAILEQDEVILPGDETDTYEAVRASLLEEREEVELCRRRNHEEEDLLDEHQPNNGLDGGPNQADHMEPADLGDGDDDSHDESWRYELVQDYYAETSSRSIIMSRANAASSLRSGTQDLMLATARERSVPLQSSTGGSCGSGGFYSSFTNESRDHVRHNMNTSNNASDVEIRERRKNVSFSDDFRMNKQVIVGGLVGGTSMAVVPCA